MLNVNKQKNAGRKEKKRKRFEAKKNSNNSSAYVVPPDPPYGVLKGGKKPLYSEYRRTLRQKQKQLPPHKTHVNLSCSSYRWHAS